MRAVADIDFETVAGDLRRRGISDAFPADVTIRPGDVGESQPDAVEAPAVLGPPPALAGLPLITCAHPGDPPTSPPAELAIRDTLGRGAMGVVQRARQETLGRDVAVKRLRGIRRTAAGAELLLTEARVTGLLAHPNIVPVHRLGRLEGGEPAMVMKHVEGVTWSRLLRDPTHEVWDALPGDRLQGHLEILVRVCRALEFAHSRRYMHLDIKPPNIMVGPFGETYLMDWGLATHLDEAHRENRDVVGTPGFLPPEMLRGRPACDERSDVFQLGATLHQVLTGSPLHAGDGVEEVLKAVLTYRPPTYGSDVPERLAAIASKAVAVRPEDRWQTVRELRLALEDFLQNRAAHRLVEAARDRAGRLYRLLDGADAASLTVEKRDRVRAHSTAARFAYEQALASLPGSVEAREGLQSVLVRTAEYELDRGNPAGAVPLLEALPKPRPDLVERQATEARALEQEVDARRALAALHRERRFAGTDWTRSVAFVVNGLLWALAVLGWGWAVDAGIIDNTPTFNVLVGAVGTVVSAGTVVALPSLFLDNEARRGFTAAYFVFIVAFDLNRVVGWILDLPFIHALMADYIVTLVFVGAVAAFMERTMWAGVAIAGAAMVATALFPAAAFPLAAATLASLGFVSAWAVRPVE